MEQRGTGCLGESRRKNMDVERFAQQFDASMSGNCSLGAGVCAVTGLGLQSCEFGCASHMRKTLARLESLALNWRLQAWRTSSGIGASKRLLVDSNSSYVASMLPRRSRL